MNTNVYASVKMTIFCLDNTVNQKREAYQLRREIQ